jgi:DNA-directed RNA polymerase specialized sigma24 family protein
VILSQAALLLDRRWTEAAAALRTSESTLRYRWTRVLQRLRDCVEGKTGQPFAPEGSAGDS